MKIEDLWLAHFGKFHNKHISLNSGMNVVEGNNEAGKSTIHSFIYACLFGLDSTPEARAMRTHYKPWDDRGAYCGAMKFSEGGREYIVERGFDEENTYIHLTDMTSGREIVPAQEKIFELLGGLNEDIFLNTVSIGQMKSVSVPELAAELKEHVNNLGSARNLDISIQGAEDKLNADRRALEKRIDPEADAKVTEATGMMTAANAELDSLIEGYGSMAKELTAGKNREFSEFSDRQKKSDELKKKIDDLNAEVARLKAEAERYDNEKDEVAKAVGGSYLNDTALQMNKAPGMPPLGIFSIVMLALLVVGGIAVGVLLALDKLIVKYAVIALIAMVVLAGVCVALLFVSAMNRKRRRNFYRLAADKLNKAREAKNALTSAEEQRARVLSDMAELDRSGYEELHRRNEELEKELLKNEWQQQSVVDRLRDLQEKLAVAKRKQAENDRLRRKISDLRLALQYIFAAAETIENSFGDRMLSTASKYFHNITAGAYDEIIIDENHRPKLRQGKRIVDLTEVSRGTIEQAYLCIRLSASECMSRVNMPLMLDDTFAFFDDDRTRSALELLKNSGHQVIIMTCQKREKKLLK